MRFGFSAETSVRILALANWKNEWKIQLICDPSFKTIEIGQNFKPIDVCCMYNKAW